MAIEQMRKPNKHTSSEAGFIFKVYLHIPPYFVFADSGGSVRFGRCAGLLKHFLGVNVKKSLPVTASLVLISGRSAKALASLLHICTVSPEPSLNV